METLEEKTILVVEDEIAVRKLVSLTLQSARYRVLEAGDGTEAVEQCKRPELIVLAVVDICLPGGLHGQQLTEKMACHQPGMPVLFMSGWLDDTISNTGIPPSAHMIQKPFTPREFLGVVSRVLSP